MRTITALYDDYADASRAVSALEEAGIPSSDISIVANNTDRQYGDDATTGEAVTAGAGVGAAVGGVGGLLTGLGLMAIPGVGPVVAAGWLATTAAGGVAGAAVGGAAAGIVAGLTESGVPERDAHVYAEGVRRGGAMVVAKVDEGKVDAAEAILSRSNRVDVDTRRSDYETTGWNQFDPTLPPYTADEISRERDRIRPRL